MLAISLSTPHIPVDVSASVMTMDQAREKGNHCAAG